MHSYAVRSTLLLQQSLRQEKETLILWCISTSAYTWALFTLHFSLILSSLSRGCLLCYAKWQVSWLLPGSASSQDDVPVTCMRCTKKANTVAGTAPALHRIPSLPCLDKETRYHHLRHKGTIIYVTLQEKRQKKHAQSFDQACLPIYSPVKVRSFTIHYPRCCEDQLYQRLLRRQ